MLEQRRPILERGRTEDEAPLVARQRAEGLDRSQFRHGLADGLAAGDELADAPDGTTQRTGLLGVLVLVLLGLLSFLRRRTIPFLGRLLLLLVLLLLLLLLLLVVVAVLVLVLRGSYAVAELPLYVREARGLSRDRGDGVAATCGRVDAVEAARRRVDVCMKTASRS